MEPAVIIAIGIVVAIVLAVLLGRGLKIKKGDVVVETKEVRRDDRPVRKVDGVGGETEDVEIDTSDGDARVRNVGGKMKGVRIRDGSGRKE